MGAPHPTPRGGRPGARSPASAGPSPSEGELIRRLRAVGARALLLDWGGVLMRTVDPGPRVRLARALGLSREALEARVFGHRAWEAAQLGDLSPAAAWAWIARDLGWRGPPAAFRAAFFAGDRLNRPLLAAVRTLKGEGARVGLLSNYSRELEGLLAVHGLATFFSPCLISARLGRMKPDPAVYRRALAAFRLPPDRVFFVDDAPENVAAARRLGMHGWVYGTGNP